MAGGHDSIRRTVMTALATLPLGGSAATAADRAFPQGSGSRTLVAYFSRSGNTRVVAGLIHRARGADLFEIVPVSRYPEEYLATVAQAREERDRGHEPGLGAKVGDMGGYATVFLGFPIWGETVPQVVRSFLSAHDLSGKTLIPFITHGGYGLGNARSVLAKAAPRAQLLDGFVIEADQERRTMEQVTSWLSRSTGT